MDAYISNPGKLFIGGEWAEPATSARADIISPFSEKKIASVPLAGLADVDRAVMKARQAFDFGPWPTMTLDKRIEVMQKLSEAFATNRNQIAQTVTAEMGCPITLSDRIQSNLARTMLDSFIEIARDYPFSELRRSSTGNGLVLRQPKGVIAAIVPWNVPMLTAMMKLGPALLMGCTFILKPAVETALSSFLLAEMLENAGVPEGVVSILPAGPAESEYLALHPGIDKITFTGSTAVGERLAVQCGAQLKPITLELGGKSAAIFLDDADLESAVETLRLGSLRNSGQVCSLKTRLLVSRRREDELLDRLSNLLSSMPVGDPSDPDVQIGPMISSRQRDRVEGYIKTAIDEGASLVRGGTGRPEHLEHGFFVKPTIFADVQPGSTLAQEEVFGPVLAVTTYETVDEAVSIANNSRYGLNGAVFTADPSYGVSIAQRIKTGTVEINGGGVGFHCPIGGVKKSGIGREAGREGFDAYTEIKTVGLPTDYATTL